MSLIPPLYRYGAVLALIVAALAGAYWKGSSNAAVACKTHDLKQTVDAQAVRIAELEAASAMSQSAAHDAATRAAQLEKEKSDAAAQSAAVIAGLRAGTIRVRDRFTCSVQQVANPDAAAGSAAEARAGFGVKDAAVALGIAREGDVAIRELNACIDQQYADRRLLGQ